jgi:hypothetical protein
VQKSGEKKFSGSISSCLKVILLYVVPNNTSTRYTQLKAFGATMALLTSKLFSKNREVEIKDLQSVHSETYKLELDISTKQDEGFKMAGCDRLWKKYNSRKISEIKFIKLDTYITTFL